MTRRRGWSARIPILTVVLSLPVLVAAQEPETAPGAEPARDEAPVFGVESAVVLVDVVVRDGRGRAVRDLEASDFELFENGAAQVLQSFRVVSDGRPGPNRLFFVDAPSPSVAPDGPSPAVEAAPPAALEDPPPAVIAFVFDRLSAQARHTAHQAADVYLESGHVDGDVVGVFGLDLALHVLQPFTQRLEQIRYGLDRALVQANTSFASTRGEARDVADRLARNQDAATALSAGSLGSAAAGDAASAVAGSLAVQVAFDQIEADMARSFDTFERDQQGFASTNGLMAVVEGLRVLPGRKTVIFFSEGLALPATVLEQFRSVIATANRSQVSVYAVDAGGLRTESELRETRQELSTLVEQRARQEAGGLLSASSSPLTRGLERNEDMLRLNPHSGLGQLAEETGGFLVADTNELSEGFARMQEDMRFHYVLAYTPSDPRFDGRFREIEVKVDRRDVRVQSRKGYFAVPPDVVLPFRPHEATAVALLAAEAPRRDFPLWAAALTFPELERPGRVAVLVQLSGAAVEWRAPEERGSDHEADFSVVVRFLNPAGEEMDRLSQRYVLTVPERSLEAARRGDVLFFKETDLAPGRYAVEAVAHDAISDRASVYRGSVEVRGASSREVRLSSVALVQRVEELPVEEQRGENPLVFGAAMVYPSLGAPFQKSTAGRLGFYFTAYGGGDVPSPTQATIELLQRGRTLAELPTSLPEPDARGRIQYAGALPLEALPPGEFTLRVSVTDGASVATREVDFQVAQ